MRASRQAFRISRRVTISGLCRFSSLRAPRAKSPPPQAVAAAQGRLRRCRSSPMHPASPSSQRLASAPAALATPPTPFFSSLLVRSRKSLLSIEAAEVLRLDEVQTRGRESGQQARDLRVADGRRAIGEKSAPPVV